MTEQQQEQTLRNTIDIEVIKTTVNHIRDHTLAHISKDVDQMKEKLEKLEAKIDKVDGKIYYILLTVVASVVVPLLLKFVGA